MPSRTLPTDFLWGVATSAQQIEGAVTEGGRGESVWDRFAATPGKVADGTDPRVACDHYHRWREDLGLLQWLGVGAYRFSIAWPRVLPAGRGRVNAAGLDFYDALVDALLAAGIRPFVTLDHWDMPQALEDRGGWRARETCGAFVEYADAVSRRLGDRVRHWVTHNEPWCIAHLGHERGVHAPGRRDPAGSLAVAHHVMLSHGQAVEVLRRNAPGAEVGIVLILSPVHPASASEADREAVRQLDGTFNRWYLDPLFRGTYPADAIADRVRLGHLPGPRLDFVHPGDLDVISVPVDFLGVNYYSRSVVQAGPGGTPAAVQVVPDHELTAMGWEVYPQGMVEVLERVTDEYGLTRLYVTESGAAYTDGDEAPEPVAEARRLEYLRAHVRAVHEAVAAGVPLHGYFVWSLMDNFEWAQGLEKRFGLFHVDYASQRRTPRRSASWYRDMISDGAAAEAVPRHETRRVP